MSKRRTALFLTLIMMVCALPGALAQSYSFPYAGVRISTESNWVLLTPETIPAQAELLAQLGVDADVLLADYAASHTVFETYLPEGMQVALNAVSTPDTQGWSAIEYMDEASKETLLAAYAQAPYEDAAWADDLPGCLRFGWTVQAGGLPVSFAGLATVKQGMLYTLMASGASVPVEALHAANKAVLENVQFLGNDIEAAAASTGQAATVPAPIEDDGVGTPLTLEDFSGISYDENTTIHLYTTPGAEVALHTSTDLLRGKADANGQHKFVVSTKRETVYTYTLTAQADGRQMSTMPISIERQLTDEARAEAYRKSAKTINNLGGYSVLRDNAASYTGTALNIRGRIGDFADIGGFPCALVYTENPGRGQWRSPVWVILTEAVSLSVDDIRTMYGDIRGDTMPYVDENGDTQEAPVIVSRSITD